MVIVGCVWFHAAHNNIALDSFIPTGTGAFKRVDLVNTRSTIQTIGVSNAVVDVRFTAITRVAWYTLTGEIIDFVGTNAAVLAWAGSTLVDIFTFGCIGCGRTREGTFTRSTSLTGSAWTAA